MLELYNGRPEIIDGRMEREIRVYDFLDALHVEYQRLDHEAADTMEVCADIDNSLGAIICKNLFLCNRQKTKYYLLMIPGDKKFLTKDISQQIGSARLSFAGAEDMLQYLDTLPGSVSVLGLMNDKNNVVQLLIDEEVLNERYFGCHPCANTSSLRLEVEKLQNIILPAIHHNAIVVKLPRYE